MHRRDEFRASKIMLERARAIDNIEWLTPYTVEEFLPGEQRIAEHRTAANTADDSTRDVEIGGAFIAVGHEPQSQLVAARSRSTPPATSSRRAAPR